MTLFLFFYESYVRLLSSELETIKLAWLTIFNTTFFFFVFLFFVIHFAYTFRTFYIGNKNIWYFSLNCFTLIGTPFKSNMQTINAEFDERRNDKRNKKVVFRIWNTEKCLRRNKNSLELILIIIIQQVNLKLNNDMSKPTDIDILSYKMILPFSAHSIRFAFFCIFDSIQAIHAAYKFLCKIKK